MEMEFPDLKSRRRVVAWLAIGLGVIGFILILAPRGMAFALQYSVGLIILTMICFRWLTSPVHPGILGYLSPHTIVLVHSYGYFGLGPLPRLVFPGARTIGNYNLRADEYYLPMLLVCLAGLLVFDLVYRRMSRALSLNSVLKTGVENFHSPGIQGFLPGFAFSWYFLCLGIFIYMTNSYVMQAFNFAGVESAIENIFLQGGPWLLGTAWIMLSFLLAKPSFRFSSKLLLLMFVFLLPMMLAYQNRRIIIYCLAVTLSVYYIYPRRAVRLRTIIGGMLLILGGFILMTAVKYVIRTDPSLNRYVMEDRNIFRRARLIVSSPGFLDLESMDDVLRQTMVIRLSGLDWAAAMMEARSNYGMSFLGGRHNLRGAALVVPQVIWPGKPQAGVATMVNLHFELAKFDQLVTILGSAYADGGLAGVLLGFGFLGFVFPPAIRLIFRRRDGLVVYLGALLPLLDFENFLLKYFIQWLRWILIIMAINSVLVFACSSVFSRREKAPGQ